MNIWVIMIIVMVLSYIIQLTLNSKFDKYSRIPGPHGLTGADVARLMLRQNGINDVTVQSVAGKLTDHFNPQDMTINLSEGVYNSTSVAACAVAAHETGHAIQHATGYAPLRLRSALIPVVTFANNTVQWVLLLGVIMINVFPSLLWIGIGLFAMTTLFSLVTLPVEINASQRAIAWLAGSGVVDDNTKPYAVDALKWAAYTYVIAAIGSLATLFYYIGIANSRKD
ncbi:MAG: zinc metallopeptidase [Bacteroides sp.]|nr:zinc metallopeptidase [Bacteroidales bacterium]MCI6679773.1 zinc metallopeptidase [Bacteroides sp.]MDD7490598.1 zinc metallopeptidase [Bacteroides sp.]MDY5891177.1 zinc metallopeptidase [Candidatus Cryptobacteroides sp.]